MIIDEDGEKLSPTQRYVAKYSVINEEENESVIDELPGNQGINKVDYSKENTNKNVIDIPAGDEIYIIRNKDTGEIFDMRNENQLAKVHSSQVILKQKETPWQHWW